MGHDRRQRHARPEDRFASAPEFAATLSLASKGTLDPDTRARAQALIARNPWGRSLLEARKEKPSTQRESSPVSPEG